MTVGAEANPDYFQALEAKLRPQFSHAPQILAQIVRIVSMGPAIQEKIELVFTFSLNEFRAAAWLRHIQCTHPRGNMQFLIAKLGFEACCLELLAESPFENSERARIVDAAIKCDREEAPNDSPLAHVLRAAYRTNYMGAQGILAIAAAGGNAVAYDYKFLQVLEWYRDSWLVRTIVDLEQFCFFVYFLHKLGEEEEIKEALGPLYPQVMGSLRGSLHL